MLFSPSSLSAIRVVSSAYLKLLIFLWHILISTCNSSSQAFLNMYSAYRLNKQGDNRQPCHTSFSILNQSVVPYRVLAIASWPTYRFLRRQVRYSGIPISMKWSEVKSLSHVWLFVTPWTEAYQAPQSVEFFRQEYWSGLPFPSPGDLPNPGIEPGSPALQADALPSEPPRNPISIRECYYMLYYTQIIQLRSKAGTGQILAQKV